MGSEWRELPISQMASIYIGGTPSRSVPEYWGGEIKWASARDIASCTSRYIRETQETINALGLEKSAAKMLGRDTILITARGTVGAICMLAEPMAFNQTCYGLVAMRNTDPAYLYYALKASLSDIATISYGTVFNTITMSSFDALKIPQPPLPEQRAIAHILGTLDDKIELNRRMNETLEQIARAIFKSWFVDFEPVRAKMSGRWKKGESLPGLPAHLWDLFPDRLVPSELGDIPEGWKAGTIKDVLSELVTGSRPKGGAVVTGVPSIGAENIIGLGRYDYSKEKYIPEEFFNQLKSRKANVHNGDVLLYKDGAYIGRKTYFDFSFPHETCAINEHVFILRTRTPWLQRYLFLWLDLPAITQEIIALNSSSAQPGINKAGVNGIPLLLPLDEIVNKFDQIVKPMFDRIFKNCLESRSLSSLRNLLLPKLIGGAIRLNNIEKFMENKTQ